METILAIYEAVRAGMRIVTVHLLGSDYDFGTAAAELEALESHLESTCNETELTVFRRARIVPTLPYTLSLQCINDVARCVRATGAP